MVDFSHNPICRTRQEKSKQKPESAQNLSALHSSIAKCEKARLKLKEGSPQQKWVDRQLEAFYIAVAIMEKSTEQYTKNQLQAALKTLKILTGKCERLQEKFVSPGSQRTLADRRLKAFQTATAFLETKIESEV
ncbi:MAG: hypothetical protein FWD58_05170 [Firmicutes bacterium]|nr:hypothetical protein [Bacillota bacterium]